MSESRRFGRLIEAVRRSTRRVFGANTRRVVVPAGTPVAAARDAAKVPPAARADVVRRVSPPSDHTSPDNRSGSSNGNDRDTIAELKHTPKGSAHVGVFRSWNSGSGGTVKSSVGASSSTLSGSSATASALSSAGSGSSTLKFWGSNPGSTPTGAGVSGVHSSLHSVHSVHSMHSAQSAASPTSGGYYADSATPHSRAYHRAGSQGTEETGSVSASAYSGFGGVPPASVSRTGSSMSFTTTSASHVGHFLSGDASEAGAKSVPVAVVAGSGSSGGEETYTNHGLHMWHAIRREWRGGSAGGKKRPAQAVMLDYGLVERTIRDQRRVLKLPQAVPLGQMVDILTDMWEDDGLYD